MAGHRIIVTFREPIWKRIAAEAKRTGKPVSEMANDAMDDWLKARRV